MENSDDYLMPVPELPLTKRIGRLPSLRVLKARRAAREVACLPTRASSSEMLTKDNVGRLKFSRQCPRRGISNHSFKGQGQIPSSVAIAGAAGLGLRRRNRHTSEPPRRTMKVASKSALISLERAKIGSKGESSSHLAHVCFCVTASGFTPKPPAVPRTDPGGRRLFNTHVLHLASTEVSPSCMKKLPQEMPM